MNGLAAYEIRVRDALGDPGDSMRGADVLRWSVRQWSAALLRNVCPLTSTLLVLRGTYGEAVDRHIGAGGRDASLHAWGRAFLGGLAAGRDPLVARVALLELVLTAPQGERPDLPEPWLWDREPSAVLTAILSGRDPEGVPRLARCLAVTVDADGRLAAAPT